MKTVKVGHMPGKFRDVEVEVGTSIRNVVIMLNLKLVERGYVRVNRDIITDLDLTLVDSNTESVITYLPVI